MVSGVPMFLDWCVIFFVSKRLPLQTSATYARFSWSLQLLLLILTFQTSQPPGLLFGAITKFAGERCKVCHAPRPPSCLCKLL